MTSRPIQPFSKWRLYAQLYLLAATAAGAIAYYISATAPPRLSAAIGFSGERLSLYRGVENASFHFTTLYQLAALCLGVGLLCIVLHHHRTTQHSARQATAERAIRKKHVSVLAPPDPRRASPRQRTRLRTGKILDHLGNELATCIIIDRSVGGARILMNGAMPTARRLVFLDDLESHRSAATVVWTKGNETGLRLTKMV